MTTTTYAWVLANPNPLVVNTSTAGNQSEPAIVAAAPVNGVYYFTAWTHPGASNAVQGRLVDRYNVAASSEFLVNSTGANNQQDASLAALNNGRYVAAFTDYSGANADIRLRLFEPSGAPVGNDFLVNPASQSFEDTEADIAALANGQFVVTWTRRFSASDTDIRYALYNADGSIDIEVGAVNSATDLSSASSVAALAGAAGASSSPGSPTPAARRPSTSGASIRMGSRSTAR
jgi:hypothetical protein